MDYRYVDITKILERVARDPKIIIIDHLKNQQKQINLFWSAALLMKKIKADLLQVSLRAS